MAPGCYLQAAGAQATVPPPSPEPAPFKSQQPKLAPLTPALDSSAGASGGASATTPAGSGGTPAEPAGSAAGVAGKKGVANSPSPKNKTSSTAASASGAATKSATKSAVKSATKSATNNSSEGMPPSAPSRESMAKIADLEKLMFGAAHPEIPIDYRLDRLESEVFHTTNPEWPTNQRIQRLNETLVGGAGTAGGKSSTDNWEAGTPAAGDSNPYAGGGSGYTATNAGANNMYSPNALPPYYGASGYPYGASPYGNGLGASMYGSPNALPNSPYLMPAYGSSNALPQADAQSSSSSFSMPPASQLQSADYQKELSEDEFQQAALQVINDFRQQQGLGALAPDTVASSVARDLVADNCKRNTVSHQDQHGYNPDVRYTRAGGTDCLVETLTAIKSTSKPKLNKALAYAIVKEMVSHQDDRDAISGSHATAAGFSAGWSSGHDKLIACTEIVTKQAEVASVPTEVKVGDKIDVKGVITGPYKFSRITVAWEGMSPSAGDDAEEQQDDALPYFPPLDYEAFAKHSEHDWTRTKQVLQIAGIGLALAGGVFIPPVALAAPLIAATGPVVMKPKAVSDIPIKGGVHVDGAAFSHKVQVSKENKDGIYYVTIWANTDADPTPFAISRRAILAHGTGGDDSGGEQVGGGGDKDKENGTQLKLSEQSKGVQSSNEMLPADTNKAGSDKPREKDESK